MANLTRNVPYIIRAIHADEKTTFMLSNGYATKNVRLLDGIHFTCEQYCLACIDYVYEGSEMVITNLRLIATNVDEERVGCWLSGLTTESVRELFVDLISLIVLIKDNDLRNCVISAFFDESLNPITLGCSNDMPVIENMYENILNTSLVVHRGVMVGIAVTSYPPYRSVRALLTHTAPTSGV